MFVWVRWRKTNNESVDVRSQYPIFNKSFLQIQLVRHFIFFQEGSSSGKNRGYSITRGNNNDPAWPKKVNITAMWKAVSISPSAFSKPQFSHPHGFFSIKIFEQSQCVHLQCNHNHQCFLGEWAQRYVFFWFHSFSLGDPSIGKKNSSWGPTSLRPIKKHAMLFAFGLRFVEQ